MEHSPNGKSRCLKSLADYAPGGIVSKTLVENEGGTLTFFAFDKDQALSEHSAPFDAVVQILEGKAEITLAGVLHAVEEGNMIIMPANVPHALRAPEKFKMLLTMFKNIKRNP